MAAVTTTKVANKPAAAGVAAPLAVVLVWVAGQFDIEVPPDVAAAIAATLIAGAYWVVPSREPAG
jgi:hypothetical protein